MAEEAVVSLTQAQLKTITNEIRSMAGRLGVNWFIWDRAASLLEAAEVDLVTLADWTAESIAAERISAFGVVRHLLVSGYPDHVLKNAVIVIHYETTTLEVISVTIQGE